MFTINTVSRRQNACAYPCFFFCLLDLALGEEAGAESAGVQAESGPATKRSLESVKAGERLMDSLELAEQEEGLVKADGKAAARAKRRGEVAPPARRPNPVLLNLSPLRYVLRTLQVCGR